MYKKRGASLNLKEVLAKIEGKTLPRHKPVVYSTSDILSAKNVLERLLGGAARSVSTSIYSEVSYTKVVVTVDREI